VSRTDGSFFYAGVSEADEERERRVTARVQDRLAEWQAEGLVPDTPIEPGDKTLEAIQTRGWTHWHHLFNPRHLLIGALIRRRCWSSPTAGLAWLQPLALLQL
jgi:adenine-specific DNA methylase